LQVEATDSAGYSLSYAATGLPDGLALDPQTGLISGTVADDAVSSAAYSVTVTADDGVGESTSLTFLWRVNVSPITAQGSAVSAASTSLTGAFTEGAVVGTEGSFNLALFQDDDLSPDISGFTVAIDPGDGSAAVSGDLIPLGGGQWGVSLLHDYAQTGTYT